MKNTALRLIALLLCFSFLLLTGCNGEEENSKHTSNDSSEENAEGLTKDLIDLNCGYDLDEGAESVNGDVLVIQLNNTALFAMNSGVMPNLSAFAEANTSFGNFYAQQGEDEGVYSSLTSLYAPLEGDYKDSVFYGLAHIFAENGYKVQGCIKALKNEDAKALGIDENKDKLDLTVLNDGNKDFLFTELGTVEYPYIPLNTEDVPIEGNRALNSYLCCAANLDEQLGEIFKSVGDLGDKAPTVIVYGTAPKLDGKFSVYGEEYPELFPNGFSYDQVFKVPFIVSADVMDKGTVNTFATVYDVFPTLAALYGFNGDKMLVSGVNLYKNSQLPQSEGGLTEAQNLALNKSYTVSLADGGEPAYMFASLADDGKRLTDGTSDDNQGLADSEIGVVFRQCDRTHYVTVDLGEVKTIDRAVMAGVAYDNVIHLGLSDGFELAVSTDGNSFTAVSGDLSTKTTSAGVYQNHTKALSNAAEARYVRFGFSGGKGYLSLTEVMVYEALPETEDTVGLKDFRFFAPQGEYTRGTFITDTVYYTKGSGAASVYAKNSMNEISARTYKDHHKAVLNTINQCEYAVKCGYFGGDKNLEQFYETLPNVNSLILATEGGDSNGSMAGTKGYLSNYNVKYTAASLAGIWDGLTVKDGVLTLEEGAERGSVTTVEILDEGFERLYVVPEGKLNGGTLRVYASYVADNGVSTAWLLVDEYKGSGRTDSLGYLDICSADGGSYNTKSYRLKIELEGTADTKPCISALNVTEARSAEAVQTVPDIEEAIEVMSPLNGGVTYDSGIVAVEALVAKALSAEPDFENANAYICGGACGGDSAGISAAALARYAQEKGINAFVDVYGIEDLINALSLGQPIAMKYDGKFVIAIGYSQNGITAVSPTDGTKTEIPFGDISINTEVLIVDSALFTPQIIEDIVAEDSAIRPGIVVDKKKYIVIHCTGNYAPGSTASAHAQYLHGLAESPDRSVSWHYTVDSNEIYHHLPDNEGAWHASDGTYGEGNQFGIGIETCVNGFPGVYEGEAYEEWLKGFTVTLKNLSYLVAKLMIENDIGFDGIKQHYDFAPDKKNCPMQMRYSSGSGTFEHEGDMWVYLMEQIKLQYNRLIEEGYGQ
ncbi:MAG: N-acetylmuramoyl-L-alanine amidase [Clostridia bacterium]|nr:N-acetylmuramoyl-L-alanine amidase [Clostridia bacterium]